MVRATYIMMLAAITSIHVYQLMTLYGEQKHVRISKQTKALFTNRKTTNGNVNTMIISTPSSHCGTPKIDPIGYLYVSSFVLTESWLLSCTLMQIASANHHSKFRLIRKHNDSSPLKTCTLMASRTSSQCTAWHNTHIKVHLNPKND